MDFDRLDEWLEYYASCHPKRIDMSLGRIREVAQRLSLLDHRIPLMLIGGTNGKGSTCAMLSSILQAESYRVGLFVSPHLRCFNERIRINQHLIGDDDLVVLFQKMSTVAPDISLTYFEAATVAAMLYFVEQKVDAIILEVGMGGRLDSTNIFEPLCSAVVSIDLDHQSFLGETREAIATEKAGIFRQDRPAVCGDPNPPATLLAAHPDLWCFGKDFGYDYVQEQQVWHYWFRREHRRLSLPLPALRGHEQLMNASVALTVLHAVHEVLPTSQQAIRQGLLAMEWPGRFQVLAGRPIIVLDVAHNVHSVRAMLHNMARLPFCQKFYAVYSMLEDKDIDAVLQLAEPHMDAWYISGLDGITERGRSTQNLHQQMLKTIPPDKIVSCNSVSEAFKQASCVANPNDAIIVFGSFYTVAEVMATIEES